MRPTIYLAFLLAADCGATSLPIDNPSPPPGNPPPRTALAYPPSLVQLDSAHRDALVADLRAHSPYQFELARTSSFGDLNLASTDPNLVEQRLDNSGFTAAEIAKLEQLVIANAALFHIHDPAQLHLKPTDSSGRYLEWKDATSDGVTTINAARSWYSTGDHKVHAALIARFRRAAPAIPDATSAMAALRARLVGAPYDRVVHMQAHPCDPVGPRDTCPRSTDEKTRVAIEASQVVVGTGTFELIRGRGMPLETHAVACATLTTRPPEHGSFNASFAFAGESYVAVDGSPQVPLFVDLVTGEDLTAQTHSHGSVGCFATGVRGASYDTGEFETE